MTSSLSPHLPPSETSLYHDLVLSRSFGSLLRPAFAPFPILFGTLLASGFYVFNLGTIEEASNGLATIVCGLIVKDFVIPKINRVEGYVVCPGVDMCNHSEDPNARVEFEYFGDCYSLVSTRGIREGEEICITYGERDNDALFSNYGFTVEERGGDCYVLDSIGEWDVGMLESELGVNVGEDKIFKLNELGMLDEGIRVDEGGGLDEASEQGEGIGRGEREWVVESFMTRDH